jgi:ankyrin repeat protein
MSRLLGAAGFNQIEVVRELLAEGIDVNIKNTYGYTALHEASINGHPEMVKFLIANGADITITNNDGNTPLHFAARYGQIDAAKELLDNGADIDARNNFGRTPKLLAISYDDHEVVALLEEYMMVDIKEPEFD